MRSHEPFFKSLLIYYIISTLQFRLPIARTCFNQLIIPDYQDRHVLRQKMAIALAHGEGFGLE